MASPRLVARGTHSENSTSGSFAFRVQSDAGANHALVVRLYNRGALASPTVTYAGDTVGLVVRDGARSDNNARWAALFVLVAPDAGLNTLSVTWGSGAAANWHCVAEHWCDVDQTTPYGTAQSRNANGTTTTGSSISVASASGDMVIDAIAALDSITVGTDQVAGPKYPTPGSHLSYETAVGTTTTMDWTWASASSSVGHVGVALKGAGSSSSPTYADHSGARANTSWLVGSRVTAESATTGQTVYAPLTQTTEAGGTAGGDTLWGVAGDMQVGIRVSANATTAASTVTLMVNGVASSTTISIAAGTTGELWSTTATTIDADDKVSWKIVNGGGGTLSWTGLMATFTPTDTDVTMSLLAAHSAGSSSVAAGLTRYGATSGARVVGTGSSEVPLWVAADGALSNLRVAHSNQTRSFTTTVSTLVNGSTTALEQVYGSTDDDIGADTSSVSVALGDRVQHQIVTASGTGAFDLEALFTTHESATEEWLTVNASSQLVLTNATDQWVSIGGELAAYSSEAAAQFEAPFAFTALRLWVEVSANTGSGTSGDDTRITLRVNGADTDMAVRIPRGDPVGVYVDYHTAVVIEAGDLIAIQTRADASSGSLTIRALGLVGVTAGGGGAQTLTPDLFTNSNTFYTHTVTTGAVTLTPDLFTNTNSFYTPTVSSSYTVTPNLFTNTNTFYTPVVTNLSTLYPDLFTNSQTFYTHVVTGGGGQTLEPELFSNSATFYGPTITVGSVTLTASLFTNTNDIYSHTVTSNYPLTPDLFSNSSSFYTPTISVGAVTLTPSLFTNSSTFYTHTISNSSTTIYFWKRTA